LRGEMGPGWLLLSLETRKKIILVFFWPLPSPHLSSLQGYKDCLFLSWAYVNFLLVIAENLSSEDQVLVYICFILYLSYTHTHMVFKF
jgi:hypothetical protein